MSDPNIAWDIVVAAARSADRAANDNQRRAFAIDSTGGEARLRSVPDADPDAIIEWNPGSGWQLRLIAEDARRAVVELYLPICSAVASRPITIGHLGQSLDGFIATLAGESRWVTGQENLLHMHRLRALCDAVVVGAGPVAADDPQLTTRLVPGPNPLRVVLDPGRRLGDHHRVFHDDEAETLYVCARSLVSPGEERFGQATVVAMDDHQNGIDVRALLKMLRA